MKYTKIILLLSAVLLLGSCMDNFLDVKPMGKLIPEKAADFENLLNNDNTVEFQFMDGNRGIRFAYLGDNYKITQALSENRFTPGAVNMDRYAAYVFYDPVTNPMEKDVIWDNLYKAISVFNSVIDGVQGLSDEENNSDLGQMIIAQAKAARAWCYLNGVFIWGPMWNPTGSNDTRVMPYRTTSSPVVSNPDLHTTTEIFEFIKTDLEEALSDVPEQVSNPSRANKTAVRALLAQYYMYQRNWSEMLQYANQAWGESLSRVNGDVDKLIYNLNDFQYIEKTVSPKPGESREVYLSLGYFPEG
ncbi:MAG: RagB/SusD family nutrient uptake outer membrane protein, partial [Bacteroidales bacterium]|nr:RagB/SusD family nutrient uptake outer membrane protein [Bacteroidales bacterium]